MKTHAHIPARGGLRSQLASQGFTLIELMIAIAMGVSIIAGLSVFLINNIANSRTNERVTELQINGRYALDSIRQELLHAGNLAYTSAAASPPRVSLGTLASECLEAGAPAESFVSNVGQAVWGSNNSNPFSSNCIPTANTVAGEDVLVVRRLADTATSTPLLNTSTVYFASSYPQGEPFRGSNTPSFVITSPLENFAVQVYVYYISPYTVSANEVPKVPALYRLALDATGTMTPQLVVSGIEHFHVQYAVLDTAGVTRYYDTISGNSYLSATGAAVGSNWDYVNAVRIWLLARNATPEPGYANTTTYTMGDQNYVMNDGYQRQLFTAVVQLRNRGR
jgi:type IV pilus assembly protein PilW